MKQRIYNSNSLEFYNDDNSKKGEIKISGSDVIINPIDSNGTVIFGEAGTINDIEIGASGTPVDFTFLGGGTITSNGNTLTLGESGDTVDLSNATIGTITASIFKGGSFIGDGSGLTSTPSTFTHITASGNISASGTIDTNTIQPTAGSLIIKSSPITEIKGANDEYIARFIENGSVDLYYNNNF